METIKIPTQHQITCLFERVGGVWEIKGRSLLKTKVICFGTVCVGGVGRGRRQAIPESFALFYVFWFL